MRECPKGIVGKPVTFLVETSRAGPGNLEVTGAINNFIVGLNSAALDAVTVFVS